MYFTQHFWELLFQGIRLGSLYALIAIGYTMVYGVLQLINFAHSEVFMSGALGGVFMLTALAGTNGNIPSGFSAFEYTALALIAGAVVSAAVAFSLERVAYRPLRKRHAPKLVYLITAIGASIFLYNLAGKLFGRNNLQVPESFHSGPVFVLPGTGPSGPRTVKTLDVLIIVTAFVMMVVLDLVINRTKLGSGIRAVAQDAETAQLMGVDVGKVISRTFIIGGLLAGVGGVLYAMFHAVSYTMGFIPGIKAFTAAVLGGIGNVRGAMLGGLLLGIVESFSQGIIPNGLEWVDVVSFVVLVVVLLIRPTGILGERTGRAA
ncbi:branched-chain amino acid ABC transporter permease [Catenulispora pinisilvae]|uniref:branched-chain amino acid ABC transporter permease n=1 Tax=Catenulispora pinisilvae TaxID=2705253 RepID=UPI0018912961|nr:branched-chain amino acid ABC transporter permease [Catenulispora pinisilvae]